MILGTAQIALVLRAALAMAQWCIKLYACVADHLETTSCITKATRVVNTAMAQDGMMWYMRAVIDKLCRELLSITASVYALMEVRLDERAAKPG
jgi:hypothetical protein